MFKYLKKLPKLLTHPHLTQNRLEKMHLENCGENSSHKIMKVITLQCLTFSTLFFRVYIYSIKIIFSFLFKQSQKRNL